MVPESKAWINEIFNQKKEFVILALTGKIRSGTSDVCKLLTSLDFPDRATQPADTTAYDSSEVREYKLVYRYLHHNWKPFIELSVTGVIISFLLEVPVNELMEKREEWDNRNIYDLLKEALEEPNFWAKVQQRIEMIDSSINFGQKEKMLYMPSAILLKEEIGSDLEKLISAWEKVYSELGGKISESSFSKQDVIIFFYGIFPELSDILHNNLKENDLFTRIFQDLGNNLRACGTPLHSNQKIEAKNIFILPKRINQAIKFLRYYNELFLADAKPRRKTPVFIVINNLKNIFEAYYFRCRYAAFYLISVACDEGKRRDNFANIETFYLTQINENLTLSKALYKKAHDYEEDSTENLAEILSDSRNNHNLQEKLGFNDAQMIFLKKLYSNSTLLKYCFENNLVDFVLQDVTTCIENADIFLMRDYKEPDYKCDYQLIRSLGRIVTLIMHPGLLTPTKIERCMQVAMTAKVNSGCLSRQVGAVVTNPHYEILSLGWNDPPCGAEVCIRRNIFDLFRKHDDEAYSDYELYDENFRKYLDDLSDLISEEDKFNLHGLPYAFCFKDIYQNIIRQRDQIYTRSLHGEERALAACDNEKMRGGFLFTTSSPCELCAKKIKEAGIKRIYYIEQYPGISRSHIINIGKKEDRAEFILFVGAIGLAYVRLYTPLLPYKDELKALGYTPIIKKRDSENPPENKMQFDKDRIEDEQDPKQEEQI